MGEITGKLIDLKPFDETYCIMVLDIDQIWGPDELAELKISKRAVAEIVANDESRTDVVEDLLKSEQRWERVKAWGARLRLKRE